MISKTRIKKSVKYITSDFSAYKKFRWLFCIANYHITGFSSPAEKEIIRNSSETSGLNMNSDNPSENGIYKSTAPATISSGNSLHGKKTLALVNFS